VECLTQWGRRRRRILIREHDDRGAIIGEHQVLRDEA
jgi:hypothetical protein